MTQQVVWEPRDSRRLIGLTEATQVAKILCEHPDIKAVVAFGSVARDHVGEDLDIILLCDEDIVQDFFDYVNEELDDALDSYTSVKDVRRDIALTALANEELDYILEKVQRFVSIWDLDMFIFPPKWRERLDELQHALPHSDPQFMANIARDARALWVNRNTLTGLDVT